MAKSSASIKTIIPAAREMYAAFMPDKDNDIDLRIVPIVCLSLISFDNEEDPDEVIGQIAVGDAILEVTYVDEDEGFGKFLGYYYSEESAKVSILAAVAEVEDEDFSNVETSQDEDLDDEESDDDDEEEDDEDDDEEEDDDEDDEEEDEDDEDDDD